MCCPSLLTCCLVPRQYLSGEAGDAMVGEDSGEAWSGGVTGLCGVALVLGAAVWLRLPGLLYEFGAGKGEVLSSVHILPTLLQSRQYAKKVIGSVTGKG